MSAVSLRLPDDISTRLQRLAEATGRSKTFYMIEAIRDHLDDLEDLYLAEQRLLDARAGKSDAVPLASVEADILAAFEQGELRSVANPTELEKFKSAARATTLKDRRINIRISSGDLQEIQVKALEEGVPYQTLIASVLHRYVTGQLVKTAD